MNFIKKTVSEIVSTHCDLTHIVHTHYCSHQSFWIIRACINGDLVHSRKLIDCILHHKRQFSLQIMNVLQAK